MNIVLLGGSGQVGWELQRALAMLGTVAVPTRQEAALDNPDRLETFLKNSAPDVLVNAAAYTDVDGAETETDVAQMVNARAVEAMARAMTGRGLLVHYSTDYVFDGKKSGAYVEQDPTAPLGIYGSSKLDGEQAIVRAGGQHIILRTSWVYAARGRNFIRTILRLASERKELSVVGDQFGAPTSAELIADVTAHILFQWRQQPAESGIYHLSASGKTSWHDYAGFILSEALAAGAQLACRPDRIRNMSSTEFPTKAARPQNSMLDTGKISRAFQLELPDWHIHVRRTVHELMENR